VQQKAGVVHFKSSKAKAQMTNECQKKNKKDKKRLTLLLFSFI